MKSAGFSLLEMLVVLVIFAILVGIASLNYLKWINIARADAAAAEVGRSLEKASSKVRTTNKDVTFRINMPANTIELLQGGVVFSTITIDATITELACRPACTSASTTVKAIAPFGGFINDAAVPSSADIKISISRGGLNRTVYALGPAAVLKVVRN